MRLHSSYTWWSLYSVPTLVIANNAIVGIVVLLAMAIIHVWSTS